MKIISGFFLFALLTISILTFGASGTAAFADTHNIAPITVNSNVDIIGNGGEVKITGSIKNYNATALTAGAATLLVLTPDGKTFTNLAQKIPNADGTYEFKFIAGGPKWKSNGDYIIKITYGADNNDDVLINYVGGEAVISDPVAPPPVAPPVITKPVEPPPVEPPVEPPVAPPVEPPVEPPTKPEPVQCGPGTVWVDGVCTVLRDTSPPDDSGCLIATAAYGTELAPQVQLLREIRDNKLFSTTSGTTFMSGFNTVYYSFAPTVADWERESPVFKEVVKTMITPMLSTLSIMSLADEGSEAEVLGLGISVIALNLGMYIAAPALIGLQVNKIVKSRR